jgi:hypothetical protein
MNLMLYAGAWGNKFMKKPGVKNFCVRFPKKTGASTVNNMFQIFDMAEPTFHHG